MSENHFYAIIPNGKGYTVQWGTRLTDGRVVRTPLSYRTTRIGEEEPLCNVIKRCVELSNGEIPVFTYKRDDSKDLFNLIIDKQIV